MQKLLANKGLYFVVLGAVGGLLSAIFYSVLSLDESAFASWVFGTFFDGACIAGLLAFAQSYYVGKPFDKKLIGRALLIGGGCGLVAGYISSEWGFAIASVFGDEEGDLGRFLGWGMSGAGVGFAVSQVVPNMKPLPTVGAGAVGGIIGCALMYQFDSLAAGTATTGAAIGIVIALAETALRKMWLEVTVRPKGFSLEKERTLSVSLGAKPILFGCALDADVKLAEIDGAKPHFAKVSMEGSKVILQDLLKEQTHQLKVDEGFDVSNAHVVLRAKSASEKAD